MKRSIPKTTIVFAVLIVGAIVFAMPFIWMAATSVKVETELFSKGLRILPSEPVPRAVSPYVDERVYEDLVGPNQQELLDELVALIRKNDVEIPQELDCENAERQIARGLYQKLSRMLPKDIWKGDVSGIMVAAEKEIDQAVIEKIFDGICRRFCLGQIRVRSDDLQVQELGAGLPFDARLENVTPETATLIEAKTKGKGKIFAAVNYDFDNADRLVLTGTFELDFDVEKLQRIQLHMQPDDTWHELYLTVEKLGRRYVAERPVVLANSTWKTVTWQEPGPDDNSTTRLKQWYLIKQTGRSDQFTNGPRQLKLTFELRRVGRARAWWNKITANYLRVLDYMPFWRYVRTSVFLVVTNIILTVFVCSLVAYAFARLQWPGRDFCFLLMLATLMIPKQVTMIPHFLIWKNLGAYNTLTPLWLTSAFGSAFFIFMLRQFLKGVPRDLEDAARIDGCGFLRIYWHIMLPLIKPSLAAIAIFTFMGTWNDFMGPLIYIADQRLYPLAFGLYAFTIQVNNNPVLSMAASLLMTVPVIVIFFFAQRYFIQGVTLTGMKG